MNESVTFRYENQMEAVMTGLAVIDSKNKQDGRRTFHFLGIAVVFWMFIPQTVENPTNPINWAMLLLAAAVGMFVWKGPYWQNKRFASNLCSNQPQVEGKAQEEKLELKSEDGVTIYAFDQPLAAFDYENLLIINGGGGKISVIPKDQLSEQTIEQLIAILKNQLEDRFEKVAQLTHGRNRR